MTEVRAHHQRVFTSLKKGGGIRVSESVETDIWLAGGDRNSFECLGEAFGHQWEFSPQRICSQLLCELSPPGPTSGPIVHNGAG